MPRSSRIHSMSRRLMTTGTSASRLRIIDGQRQLTDTETWSSGLRTLKSSQCTAQAQSYRERFTHKGGENSNRCTPSTHSGSEVFPSGLLFFFSSIDSIVFLESLARLTVIASENEPNVVSLEQRSSYLTHRVWRCFVKWNHRWTCLDAKRTVRG